MITLIEQGKRALNLLQTLHTKLFRHQLNPSANSRPMVSISFFFSFKFSRWHFVACSLPCLLCRAQSGGKRGTFHLHVFVRPRVMIGDRNSSVKERAWSRTSSREAGFELHDAPLEIPLVPARTTRSDRPLLRSPRSVVRAREINQHSRERERETSQMLLARII